MRFARAFLLIPLMAAAWLSIRLAIADAFFRRNTPESVAQALALEPSNAEYALLRAMQIEYDGGDSTTLLQRVADLNPMDAAPRLRLGLAAEIRGDFPAAETYLLDAAQINHQFEPRWTLANFYFRRGKMEQFWKWIRSALEVSYGDRRPAFELCWNVSNDPNEVLTRAIPDNREVLHAYLQYLSETNRPAAISSAAVKLASLHNKEDRPILLESVDLLIGANDAASAKDVWRAIGLPIPSGIFRGDFEPPEIGTGFDWRLVPNQGVTHLALDQPRFAHRILFDGSEPESAELLRQIVTLQPHTRYKLTWQSRTEGFASPTGIEWRIGDQHAPIAAGESAGELNFIAPSEMAPLILNYSRPSGETRAEGSVELWRVAIVRY